MNGKVTYRQQFTRCGKQRCHKCKEGAGHGPYWYAYWSEQGHTVSKYIGIHLPEHLTSSQKTIGSSIGGFITDTTAPTTSSPGLRIYLLGQFRIERNATGTWQTVDSRTWHRRRARALLGCLLSSSSHRLAREQVMEMIWPDLGIDVAANRLNGAVHELRQILEPDIARPAASRLLRLERDILELADSTHIWVDAEAFESLLKEAHAATDTKHAETLLEAAAELYQGNYLLEELYAEWATPRRDALQRAWVGLLLKLANLQIERQAYIKAIDTLDRLRTVDPTNETALQRLMILLTQLDRRGEALQIYHQHTEMLKREYESDPLPETIKLYELLRKGDFPHIPGMKKTIIQDPPQAKLVQELHLPQPDTTYPALTFTRPIFQLGRHNQSPLIGRTRELDIMRQVLLSVETDNMKRARAKAGEAKQVPYMYTTSLQPTRSRFVLLRGESGIGKTRLAEEISLEGYTHGWAIAWSRSYEQEGTIPYRPWTELLRALLQGATTITELLNLATASTDTGHEADIHFKAERLAALLPELAIHTPITPQYAAPSVLHEQERLHLWEATLGLLNILSKTHPLLLIFDDLQWADDSSIELLIYLTHHLQNQRILFIGTCRDGELAPQHKLRTLVQDLQREQIITTITVHPLTHAQIGTLVSHLPKDVVEGIKKQASGNPFFAEELARYVIGAPGSDEGSLLPLQDHFIIDKYAFKDVPQKTPARPEISLPEAIAAVLERRLSKLSKDCQNLLGKAAILGGYFAFNQLQPIASEHDEDTLLDLLEEALRAGLLTEEGTGAHITYHFWHPLIISHLYARLSAARRALLHRKAAEAIKATNQSAQQEKVAAAIVYHLSRGGGDPRGIAYYARLAGHQAYALTAYSEAQQYYLQALQALIGNNQPRIENTDIYTQMSAITTRDIEHITTEDALNICHLFEYIAECSIVSGHLQEARHLYECILKIRTNTYAQRSKMQAEGDHERIRQQEAQIQALLWREIGNTWLYTGEYKRAYACNEHGRAVMVQAGVTSGVVWACLQIVQGDLLRLKGDYLEAQHHLEEALAMLERIIQPTSTPDLHLTQEFAMQSPSAFDTVAIIAQQEPHTHTEHALNGNPLEIGYAHERLGIVLASVGQLSNALRHMHIALNIFEQEELVSAMARICANLGAVYVIQGENNAARNSMRRSLNLAERTGDLPNTAFVMVNLGEVAHRSGDLQEAEHWLKQGLTLCEQVNDRERLSWCHADLAGVQIDLGNLQEARKNILHAITIGRAIKSSRCIHYALVILGDLRTAEAMRILQIQISNSPLSHQQPVLQNRSLLLRAKCTLQHAIALPGMEIETIIEEQLSLATVYFLQGELANAHDLARHTLQEAQEQEAMRAVGRTYRLLGRILAAQEDHVQAEYCFERASQLFHERELRLDYARTLYVYGLALAKRQSIAADERLNVTQIEKQQDQKLYTQRSMAYLREARIIFTNCHAADDLALTEQALTISEAVKIETNEILGVMPGNRERNK